MRSWLRFLLVPVTVGMGVLGCNKSPPAPTPPADVVLHVPGMN